MTTYGRPKAPAHGRRSAAPAKKELNRVQRVQERAARAIKSAEFAKLRKPTIPAPRYAVDQAELVAIPKVRRLQNKRLRDLARGMPCLLRVPDVCRSDPDTTVACHSNWREWGGKGAHRKADDTYTVWGCYACHAWLDAGGDADVEFKKRVFLDAHVSQKLLWDVIAKDTIRPEADRKAAKWALARLQRSA